MAKSAFFGTGMHRLIRSDTQFPIGATGCVNFILLRRKEGLGLICCLTKTRSLNGLFEVSRGISFRTKRVGRGGHGCGFRDPCICQEDQAITTRMGGPVKVTPKMTTSEAVYGHISTRNAQRRAAALTSHDVSHHYSALAKHCLVNSLRWLTTSSASPTAITGSIQDISVTGA